MKRPLSSFSRRASFTLIELLAAIVVLSLFVVLLAAITNSSFKLWKSTNGSIKMFASARTAYGIMGARLSQATLNTYLDYYDVNWSRRPSNASESFSTFTPAYYGRASDLHFYSGPAAATTVLGSNHQGDGMFFFVPLGYSNNNPTYADVPNLLNALGYYVEWGPDNNPLSPYRPTFLPSSIPPKYRYRLIENVLPTQNFSPTYGSSYTNFTTAPITYAGYMPWISTTLANNTTATGKSVLAENVIALIIRPEVSQQDATNAFGANGNPWNLTTNYLYDSQTLTGASRPPITTTNPSALQFAQLPPLVRLVMVAVDESSAQRLTKGTTAPAAFQLNPAWFQNVANLNTDLNSLSQQLTAAGVNYQIFNQVIALRGAQFSVQSE